MQKRANLEALKIYIMHYQLSDDFTAQPERTKFWRKFDGRCQFRIISEKFVQVFSQWVIKPDGKGYTRMWQYTDDQPILSDGERYEGNNPSRKVVFCVTPVEGNDSPPPVLLVVNQQVAKQILTLATELQGLTVADFVIIAQGTGTQKSYTVMAQPMAPMNQELEKLGKAFDILAEL